MGYSTRHRVGLTSHLVMLQMASMPWFMSLTPETTFARPAPELMASVCGGEGYWPP
eukprot:COSAG01_NODE_3243_length_6366_cov_53.945588_3_plen_56_part_00